MIEHVGLPDEIPARYYLAWRFEKERHAYEADSDDADIEVLE